MTVASVEIPEKIYSRLGSREQVQYKDIIADYEESFEYEYVGKSAINLKKELLNELSHG